MNRTKHRTTARLQAAWHLRMALVLAGLLACQGAAWAQAASAPRAISDADLRRGQEAARKEMEKLNEKNLEAARRQYVDPHKGGKLGERVDANQRAMPNVDALPRPQNVPQVDIGALADQFAARKDLIPKGMLDNQPRLLVFVTFAMPDASLKNLLAQAEAAKATVLLRGFHNNSLQQTQQKLMQLLGQRQVAFAIDPDSFDRYGIRQAPSFVLTRVADPSALPAPCAGVRCEPADNYALISGDVTLDYALENIEQRAPAFRREARAFLKKIRG